MHRLQRFPSAWGETIAADSTSQQQRVQTNAVSGGSARTSDVPAQQGDNDNGDTDSGDHLDYETDDGEELEYTGTEVHIDWTDSDGGEDEFEATKE